MEKDDYTDLKIILWLILFLVFGIIIVACKSGSREYIMTVNGPEFPGKMGITLTHEHILVDFIGADSTGYFRWNRDSVIKKALPSVLEVREKGVKTIIECTPAWLGRDPLLLKSLSRTSGMNFVTNTGYYGAINNKYLPDSFYISDEQALATLWSDEFKNGIENTGIRPGFIKIAVAPDDTLSAEHKKIIAAAAITHLKTGLVIASHTGPDKPAFEQINILRKKGVDPSAFIWVHAQSGTLEGNIRAAKDGTWISLDNIHKSPGAEAEAPYSIEWYAERIARLKGEGLLSKVLISHDSGWFDPSKPGGGTFNGYTDIFDLLIPALKAKGLNSSDIDQIITRNPQEAFRIKIRKL